MTPQGNKELIRHYLDALNRKDLEALRGLLADGYVYHASGIELHGRDAMEAFLREFFAAFPDLECSLEDLLVEGDRCACRFTMRATHRGSFFGTPATGKRIEVSSNGISHLAGGKVAEDWEQMDLISLFQQIGVMTGVPHVAMVH